MLGSNLGLPIDIQGLHKGRIPSPGCAWDVVQEQGTS